MIPQLNKQSLSSGDDVMLQTNTQHPEYRLWLTVSSICSQGPQLCNVHHLWTLPAGTAFNRPSVPHLPPLHLQTQSQCSLLHCCLTNWSVKFFTQVNETVAENNALCWLQRFRPCFVLLPFFYDALCLTDLYTYGSQWTTHGSEVAFQCAARSVAPLLTEQTADLPTNQDYSLSEDSRVSYTQN